MNSFNKIFKEIVLQNGIYIKNEFPLNFEFPDYGLEFIFDIMPTFGQQYIWHTVEDLKSIPELVSALQNTEDSIRLQIADSFNEIANRKEDQIIGTVQAEDYKQMIDNYHKIADWIYSLSNDQSQITMQDDDIDITDRRCFNTVPNVVKEVRPRKYRRGLKALSLANRKKFNAANRAEFAPPVQTEITDKTTTDKLNKITQPKRLQQPVTKSTVLPAAGVERPVGLNRTDKIKQNFANTVYQPSITQITKQAAKKRCLAQRRSTINEDTDLQFSTNYAQKPMPHIQPKQLDETELPTKKELCIVCKEYVEPKETILDNGKTIRECPKCGLRFPLNNF